MFRQKIENKSNKKTEEGKSEVEIWFKITPSHNAVQMGTARQRVEGNEFIKYTAESFGDGNINLCKESKGRIYLDT